MTDTSQRLELNARLLVIKDELRQVESAIADAESNAANPGLYYTPEEWLSLAKGLRQDAAALTQQIELLEAQRNRLTG